VLSTSGFTLEAHELAERRADRTLILVEPNDAGGYSVYGPVETKSLNDLFDPEAEDQKRRRIHETIESSRGDLAGSGVATDKLVTTTQLPLQLIEAELKNYAKANPGLVAKRLEGRIVLFREGFVFNHMGYAAAIAWLLFVIVLLLTVALFWFARRRVYYAGSER
jgi:hypothetical protein